MKKITKVQGIKELSRGEVKRVLTGYVSKYKAELLLGMDSEEFTQKTKGCTLKRVLKNSNTQIVFIDNDGKKSWLTDLTGSKWYEVTNDNGGLYINNVPR